MEHIKEKRVGARYVMLVPDAGYILTNGVEFYDKVTVLTKDKTQWRAVKADEA